MEIKSIKRGELIVSCQALPDEPLHSSFIMSKMALAASLAGASGIRANTVEDIRAIKKEVDLPIIGIIKRCYPNSDVVITPTIEEIDELYNEGVDVIAFDATCRERPDGMSIEEFIKCIKQKYPDQQFMADVSNLDEALNAEKYGVDIVAPTLVGYTDYTKGNIPLDVLSKIINHIKVPIIAEGNFDTPEKARKAIDLGAYAVVVGSAITRPKHITEQFKKRLKEKN